MKYVQLSVSVKNPKYQISVCYSFQSQIAFLLFERVSNKLKMTKWQILKALFISSFKFSKIIVYKMLSDHAKMLAMYIIFLLWLIFEAKDIWLSMFILKEQRICKSTGGRTDKYNFTWRQN